MACPFSGNKPAFQAFVLTSLTHLNGTAINLTDDLRTKLGYDNNSVRTIGLSLLQLAGEHDCAVTLPSAADYDTCNTVSDLIDLLFGHIP